jgi:undecaprenyl pyrophosphate phosphatase UppP
VNSLHKKRWGIFILFVVAVVTIISGFWLNDPVISNRLKGLGTVMIFFVVMPLFLLVESPRKKMKDYMLTEENIKKMQSDKKGSRKS